MSNNSRSTTKEKNTKNHAYLDSYRIEGLWYWHAFRYSFEYYIDQVWHRISSHKKAVKRWFIGFDITHGLWFFFCMQRISHHPIVQTITDTYLKWRVYVTIFHHYLWAFVGTLELQWKCGQEEAIKDREKMGAIVEEKTIDKK